MERREPVIEEDAEEDAEPQPETASAGGVRPPGRIGSGLWDDEGGHEPPRRPPPHWSDPNVYNMPIEDLNLSMRGYNVLRRNGLLTIGQVVRKSAHELLELRNFGHKCYDELRERLDEYGIVDLRTPLPQTPPEMKERIRRWKESQGE